MIAEKVKKPSDGIVGKEYLLFIIILLANTMFLKVVGIYEEQIYKIIKINQFLTFHIVLEFIGILVAFMIFVITYYTFNKNKRLRLLVYSSTFFIVGFLGFLHTMSYEGMPFFFTESCVAKATNFWMITRIIMAIGLFVSSIIPINKNTDLKREYFLYGSVIITIGVFYLGIFKQELIPTLFIGGQGLTSLKIYLEYFVMLLFFIAMLFYIRDYIKTKDVSFRIFAIGLCYAMLTDGAFTLYRSVYDTYNLLGHIFNIVGFLLIFRSIFVYNLDKPYKQLDMAKKRIGQYADNLEQIVERRTGEIQEINRKMLEELEYAKTIQQSLLPPKNLNILGKKFISEYIPCEKLSGDFYNIHNLDEDNIAMYIGDVAGHGVSAAMMTVFAERIMKPMNINKHGIKAITPSTTLKYLYEEFNRSNFPSEMHIVIFKAIYNTKTKVLSYCSGGMNVLPIVLRKTGEIEMLDKSTGFPICKFGDFYKPEYKNASINLNEGDRIVFYTDGLVEYFKENTLIRKDRFIDILKESANESIEKLNKEIIAEIHKNQNDGLGNDDDITYFILEV